jgi:uncharacterized protein
MGRVGHFEIHADDPERCIEFYQSIFGWHFSKWDGPIEYWLITTGQDSIPGINGGLMRRQGPSPTMGQPLNSYVCSIVVDSIDESLAAAHALNAMVAVPKMAIPNVGWLAYIIDTEGNIVGIMQEDATVSTT